MDFGKTLIGVIGYGFSLLMAGCVVAAFLELVRMRGKASQYAANEKARQLIIAAILAFGAAMFTRWTLGWI